MYVKIDVYVKYITQRYTEHTVWKIEFVAAVVELRCNKAEVTRDKSKHILLFYLVEEKPTHPFLSQAPL